MKLIKIKLPFVFQQFLSSKLAKNVGIFTVLNFFLKGISFLITPLFTNYINPDEFGRLNIFQNSINLIAPLIGLGITNSISIDFFKESRDNLSKQLSTFFLFSALITLFFCLLSLILGSFLTNYFQYSLILILLIPIFCFLNLVIDTMFILFRNDDKILKLTYYTVGRVVIEIFLSLLLIVVLLKGSEGRLWSMIIATFIIALGCFSVLVKKYKLTYSFNFNFIKKEWRFWGSTTVGFLFVLAFNVFDKYIVKYFCSADDLGLYGLATQFGFIIFTFSAALSTAYIPNLYNDLAQKASIEVVYRKLKVIILLIVFVALGSNIIVYLVLKFMVSIKYAPSWNYYLLISGVYGLWAIISVLYGFLYYFKMKKIVFLFGVFAVMLFVPLEIAATYFYNIYGIILCQFFYFLFCLMIIFRIVLKKMKYENFLS